MRALRASRMASRGALIVFEGCDRAGKSTQTRLLAQRINQIGAKAEIICFPDRTTDLGKFIDRYLKREVEMEAREAHLVFAANRQAVVDKMKEKLRNGVNLIVDRYAYSGIAYTIAKGTLTVGLEWAKLQDVGILKPDCVLFFDLPPEVARKRGGFGDERLEAYDLQLRVYDTMKLLRADEEALWRTVDASLSVEAVSEVVWGLVEPVLKSAASAPLKFIDIEPPRCSTV